jgi:hypothetical protein
MHDPGGEFLMADKNRRGWIVYPHELGHDPTHRSGFDYRPWTDQGFGAIARLNNGYGSAGTIPEPHNYDRFSQRVRNWVQASAGCHIWVIGNEMNHGQERPNGKLITPHMYAECYAKCWTRIHNLPGHEDDQVAVGAVAPWNNTTSYQGNEGGDWIRYFQDILHAIRQQGVGVDAIALHTYTHGSDPNLVFSNAKMAAPFQDYHFQFRAYRDFMHAIPKDLRHLPVYITETDQDVPWENANRGWVQNAYREIDDWNAQPDRQQIRSLVLYRWQFDKWQIKPKGGVHEDWKMAMDHEYVWTPPERFRIINGHRVSGPFLDFYERMGEESIGPPLTDKVNENGIKTQYFARLVLQLDPTGSVVLKPLGAELLALRRENAEHQLRLNALQEQIRDLQAENQALREQISVSRAALSPGLQMQDLTSDLPAHPEKRFPSRNLDDIQYLALSQSAVPPDIELHDIAEFHVQQMGWPGIGYHFFVDATGRILQTQDLTTVVYHVGEWDPATVAVCLAGKFGRQTPGIAQLESSAQLIAWLIRTLGLTLEAVRTKDEFAPSTSPDHQWMACTRWKETLLARVRAILAEDA